MNRIIFFLFLFPLSGAAQSLVLNSGFEDINICTEYRAECAPEAWISSANGFANYFKDSRRAHKSPNCMAIEAGNFAFDNRRSIIRTPLVCGMRKGAVYNIEMYVKSFHDVFDSLGLMFTATDPLFDRTPVQARTPSVYFFQFVDPMKFADSAWYPVRLQYTATGEERFFSIGYFARKEYQGERSHPMENRYFVFIDDVYVFPADPNELLCVNYSERREEIYEENERHTLLEKKIAYYKKNPPPPPPVMKNVLVMIDTLVLPDILFESGRAELGKNSYQVIDSFIGQIKNRTIDSIIVEGHTDNVGTFDMNMQLSGTRAENVRKYFMSRGVNSIIVFRGLAFLKPVADNTTPSGRQQNRRVEVFLYIRE